MKRESYHPGDFDFALAYIPEQDTFYVFPFAVFVGFASVIHMVESDKRQRKPTSASFRDAWELILQWAARGESHDV